MKKVIYTCLLFLATNLNAQTSDINSTPNVLSCDSVNTIYNSNYLNHGAMFNVIADSAVTLDHLAANINDGTFLLHLYYKTGSFVGYETMPSAWTLMDSAVVTSANTLTLSNQPTVIPININLSMNAGDTIAFYLARPGLSTIYLTNTTIPWGTVYSTNSTLSITVARSIYQKFGVPFGTPQIWNGTVSYCSSGSVGVEQISGNDALSFNAYVSEDNLHLSVSDELFVRNNNVELQLTDMLGKLVLNETIHSSSAALSTSGLPKGVYLCTLRNNTTVIGTKKIFID